MSIPLMFHLVFKKKQLYSLLSDVSLCKVRHNQSTKQKIQTEISHQVQKKLYYSFKYSFTLCNKNFRVRGTLTKTVYAKLNFFTKIGLAITTNSDMKHRILHVVRDADDISRCKNRQTTLMF